MCETKYAFNENTVAGPHDEAKTGEAVTKEEGLFGVELPRISDGGSTPGE